MVAPILSDWLIGVGLALDIVVVVILAVQDTRAATWFRFGRLREARD